MTDNRWDPETNNKPTGYCQRRGCHHSAVVHVLRTPAGPVYGGSCCGLIVAGEPNVGGADSPCKCRQFVEGARGELLTTIDDALSWAEGICPPVLFADALRSLAALGHTTEGAEP